MGKISKSDQPAHLDEAEQARLAEIDARLHDMRRGHHAPGSKWTMSMRQSDGTRIKIPLILIYPDDGFTLPGGYDFITDNASLR